MDKIFTANEDMTFPIFPIILKDKGKTALEEIASSMDVMTDELNGQRRLILNIQVDISDSLKQVQEYLNSDCPQCFMGTKLVEGTPEVKSKTGITGPLMDYIVLNDIGGEIDEPRTYNKSISTKLHFTTESNRKLDVTYAQLVISTFFTMVHDTICNFINEVDPAYENDAFHVILNTGEYADSGKLTKYMGIANIILSTFMNNYGSFPCLYVTFDDRIKSSMEKPKKKKIKKKGKKKKKK